MVALSANLGFLWTELALPSAIRAAKDAGFAAVECHFPYDQDPAAVRGALAETALPLLALNTIRGDPEAGEFGLAALPARTEAAKAAIIQAVDYGHSIGARQVHVMAGRSAETAAARATFLANLAFAADHAAAKGLNILIEPINHRDVPEYYLSRVEQAVDIIQALGRDNVKVMFDCYHVQIMQGDLLQRFQAHQPHIGHVQFAAVPSRAEPDEGEVHYPNLLKAFAAAGYDGFAGAEYRPRSTTEAGLGWMQALR